MTGRGGARTPGAPSGGAAAVLRLGHPLLRRAAAPVFAGGGYGGGDPVQEGRGAEQGRSTGAPGPRCGRSAPRALGSDVERLQATLADFRRRHGFGRAIAAPQIGIGRRFVALHLPSGAGLPAGPFVIFDPEIVWRSPETFTLWDDCMSFPELMVRVRRHCSVRMRYRDASGACRETGALPPSTSELLQHELDHLDGVLALDRAVGPRPLLHRNLYLRHRAHWERTVDGVPPG